MADTEWVAVSADPARPPAVRRLTTLRWRITLGATAIVLFALLIVSLAVAGLLRGSLERNTEELLVERVAAVEALIADGGLGPILDSTGREIGQVQVIDASGQVVSNTSGLADTTRFDVVAGPPVGERTAATVNGSSIDNDPGEEYRLVSSTVASADGDLTIFAVTSLDTSNDAQGYLTSRLLWALPLIGLITAAVIYGVVGRALSPVERMRRNVEEMSATDLSKRLAVGRHDDELARLASTMNGFLERLDASAGQQRLFAANASHELRSPLSAIRTDLEVGLAYPDRADWERTAQDSLIEIDRLERLSRDLRALTKEHDAAGHSSTDVARLVRDEVARRNSRVRFESSREIAFAEIDRDGFVQVIRNLLDNAERHATSTVDASVRSGGDGTVRVHVVNDGAPILDADRERIFEPFARLDDARSLDTGGSGLGLAISRAILTSAGATVEAVGRPTGAEFVVVLPSGVELREPEQHRDAEQREQRGRHPAQDGRRDAISDD